MVKGKKILIGITGSIAAFKIPFLIRLLVKEGAEVRVIVTESAGDFVTPLTLATLSGNPVVSGFFNPHDGTWNSHVELGNWADLFLIAPASANTLAKMANGLADNLLVATYLAARCPVFVAPAMDVDMFEHSTTQENLKKLAGMGNRILEPEVGELASGLSGPGRLQEPEHILAAIKSFFRKKKVFAGKKILVTAGPTFEAIDPVRYIGNHSSGKMGYAIAESLLDLGAEVTLISGPVQLSLQHKNLLLIPVVSAEEMKEKTLSQAGNADIIVMAAAVADYTPEVTATSKIKKKDLSLSLRLKPTSDILYELGNRKKKKQLLVGFALETDNAIENATHKLKNKNLDLIVLNTLTDPGAGFGHDTNRVTFIDRWGEIQHFDLKSKKQVAFDLALKIEKMINK